MPSRIGIVLILAFWLAVTAYVIREDVLPHYAASAPAVQVDLVDEATRGVPARWGVFHGSSRVGTLGTLMEHDPASDTFRFESSLRELNLESNGFKLQSPKLDLVSRIHRDGRLAAESMKGTLTGTLGGVPFTVAVEIESTVRNGVLEGRCRISSNVLNADEPLTPTPVPTGQVLHPLQPLNRLKDVRPGHRWTIQQVDPLASAMNVLARKLAEKYGLGSLVKFPTSGEGKTLIAEVRSDPVLLERAKGGVLCWRIDYRSETSTATTWVAVSDGKVLRQEAVSFGETLRLERED